MQGVPTVQRGSDAINEFDLKIADGIRLVDIDAALKKKYGTYETLVSWNGCQNAYTPDDAPNVPDESPEPGPRVVCGQGYVCKKVKSTMESAGADIYYCKVGRINAYI